MMHVFPKLFGLLLCLMPLSFGSTQLPAKYTIAYGNPKAPVQVVEYFSLGCAPCIELFATEFDRIRKDYVDSGKVYWVFHPHPVNLITVQAMVCLGALEGPQKQIFFEAVMLEAFHAPAGDRVQLLTAAASLLHATIPDLTSGPALQQTEAFKAAFVYQQTKPSFSGTPTLFINGQMINELPTRAVIDTHLNAQFHPKGSQ